MWEPRALAGEEEEKEEKKYVNPCESFLAGRQAGEQTGEIPFLFYCQTLMLLFTNDNCTTTTSTQQGMADKQTDTKTGRTRGRFTPG